MAGAAIDQMRLPELVDLSQSLESWVIDDPPLGLRQLYEAVHGNEEFPAWTVTFELLFERTGLDPLPITGGRGRRQNRVEVEPRRFAVGRGSLG